MLISQLCLNKSILRSIESGESTTAHQKWSEVKYCGILSLSRKMPQPCEWAHYSDVIMGAMTSQFASLTIVYSTVSSGIDQRKHQSSAALAFVRVTGECTSQKVSNAENVYVWWRHHECIALKRWAIYMVQFHIVRKFIQRCTVFLPVIMILVKLK